ncbi:MAG: tyrosine-protein phosphatase [Acidobacteriota bacterium]|jgi:protein tyrosine/serine phosphatase|nr:tyrosine-protein phosphatase [Acidobacteriota bacterium]
MAGRLSRLRILSVAVMLLIAIASAPSRVAREEVLPNFHKVNEQLYRGAQPSPGGMKELAALRIKTVINLRGEDEHTRDEEAEARAAGLRYFSVPLPGFGRPSDEQVNRVLAIINDSQNWPVFVHCHHGEDRTGTIIAVYRISHDGWSAEEARKEAKRYGMSRFQFKMKDYINDYARDHKPGVQRAAQQ